MRNIASANKREVEVRSGISNRQQTANISMTAYHISSGDMAYQMGMLGSIASRREARRGINISSSISAGKAAWQQQGHIGSISVAAENGISSMAA